VVPVFSYTVNHGGLAARHGFKLFDSSTGRLFTFSCRDVTDYRRWLEAFSVEKRVVTEDQLSGFNVTSLTTQNTELLQLSKGKQLTLPAYQLMLFICKPKYLVRGSVMEVHHTVFSVSLKNNIKTGPNPNPF